MSANDKLIGVGGMVEGYCDGLRDERTELPENSNYSPAYVHGWNNGRDDRIGKPRDSYAALKAQADTLLEALNG
jgi:hypothetical protein